MSAARTPGFCPWCSNALPDPAPGEQTIMDRLLVGLAWFAVAVFAATCLGILLWLCLTVWGAIL